MPLLTQLQQLPHTKMSTYLTYDITFELVATACRKYATLLAIHRGRTHRAFAAMGRRGYIRLFLVLFSVEIQFGLIGQKTLVWRNTATLYWMMVHLS